MYSHSPAQSTTSLSDIDDDDENKSVFFPGSDQALVVTPAQWTSRLRLLSAGNHPVQHSPMSSLPPEIVIHILRHLHTPRDLYSTLLVSRAWCECSVELLWHKPSFSKFSTLIKMMRVLSRGDQTFTYARFIRRLNFLFLGPDITDSLFSRLAQCDRLERLTLVNCGSISDDALARTLPCCPNLVAIDLTGVHDTSDKAIVGLASSARRLQGINLGGCKKVSDKGIFALASHCPLLRRVKLSGVDLVTDEPISALAKSCPLLLEIDLNNCKLITDVSVRDIWTYSTHMREMRLAHCVLTDAAFPAPLKSTSTPPGGQNPFPLSPTKSGTADHTMTEQLPPLILTRPFEHLRMLDLTACALLTDDAIDGIISHAPKIRNLVLSKCIQLTDRSVENICRLGKHLHYFHLGHAASITDRSVRTLARCCTRLRYVDFANCIHLTDMSVFELSSLSKLRRIGLVRVSNLTDEAIYSLADRHATLERIHLSYCDQISVMAIHFLLQKLHKLTHLSLTGIPAFRKPELQQFCRLPPDDFNTSQRAAFCVYSGKGVPHLRAFLTDLFDQITEEIVTADDTEDEEDYDAEGSCHDSAPEVDMDEGNEGDVDEEYFGGTSYVPHQNLTVHRGHRAPSHVTAPNIQDVLMQWDRPGRSATETIHDRMVEHLATDSNGGISRVDTRLLVAPRRIRGFAQQPIVESPPPSDVASNRSTATNQSNGAGFFRSYQEVNSSSQSNGALTPDLNFAEIGHGRGASGMVQIGPSMLALQQSRRGLDASSGATGYMVDASPQGISQMMQASTSQIDVRNGHPVVVNPPGSAVRQNGLHVAATGLNDWPHVRREAASSPPSPSPTRRGFGSGRQVLERTPTEGQETDGRGRSVKRSLRNTLNVAEHYATSFLFGRGSTMHEGSSGMGGGMDTSTGPRGH